MFYIQNIGHFIRFQDYLPDYVCDTKAFRFFTFKNLKMNLL